MEKPWVERWTGILSFFKNKIITIEALKYLVLEVRSRKTDQGDNSWETEFVCTEVGENGTSKYGTTTIFIHDSIFMKRPSLIVHQIENLSFDDFGRIRLIELLKSLIENMPFNEKLQVELIERHNNSQNLERRVDGEQMFAETIEFVKENIQHLK